MEFIIRKFDLFKLIFFNKAERDFVNLKHLKKIDKKNNKIVLVEIGLDIYFLVHFYFLLKERKFRNNKFVGLWVNPMRMRRPGFTGTIAFLFQCLVQYLIKLKWMKIYKCLGFNSFIDLSNDFKDSIFISKSNFVKSYNETTDLNDKFNLYNQFFSQFDNDDQNSIVKNMIRRGSITLRDNIFLSEPNNLVAGDLFTSNADTVKASVKPIMYPLDCCTAQSSFLVRRNNHIIK